MAREVYAEAGIDAESALQTLAETPISLHCWQGDDVGGFERPGATLDGGGIQATGNYPGRARSLDELRADLDVALNLIPGRNRINLHASYGDFGGKKVERDQIELKHFQSWIEWARSRELGVDFNPTYFSHPLANDGATLSHRDPAKRKFWIDHGIACRRIAAEMGRSQGSPCVTNLWIPDGQKDIVADRRAPRVRLEEALDLVFGEKLDPMHQLDAVESKLFGIGSESYVVGSHEFYMGYAVSRKKMLCLDMGHFHPSESVADKISAILQFTPSLLLHVSRGVRWDSDHVVLFDDPTRAVFEEVVRGRFLARTFIGLDYFDASINRIVAWVLGARNTQKCLLAALLQPTEKLRSMEEAGDNSARIVAMEESKTLPLGDVWLEHCKRQDVPRDGAWIAGVQSHEKAVLNRRA
jgi:L-rhamnose isomerase